MSDPIADVLKREGGYVNDPRDRGGATNMGITQKTFDAWTRAKGLPSRDVRGLTVAEAQAVYRDNYWKPAKCDLLPENLRPIHFDSAVQHGIGNAAKLLQEAAGVNEDGVIGAGTLAAVAKTSTDLLLARYIAARYRFYGRIVQRDRSQLAFIVGWLKRMEDFA